MILMNFYFSVQFHRVIEKIKFKAKSNDYKSSEIKFSQQEIFEYHTNFLSATEHFEFNT